MSTKNNKPIFSLRDGLIELAVFENPTKDNGVIFNYVLTRSYQDDAGEWKKSHSLSGTEPLIAASLYQRAYAKIAQIREQRRETRSDEQAAA